jgi:methylated-DNA-[protein]-cysteine S-methyltransferase
MNPATTQTAAALYGTVVHGTPVGSLDIIASDRGVRAILFGPEDALRVPISAQIIDDPSHPIVAEVARQLDGYFEGTRTDFDLPLDPEGSPFQQQAWLALCAIPYGETVSYGEQARRLGDPNKARAVGAANGRNPISIVVPCHRVIGTSGKLVGFGGGLTAKAWLLDHERRVSGMDTRLF